MDTKRHVLRRIIWVILVSAGLALALYQVEDRISSYAAFPTTTNVRVRLADVLPFPQVTICDENRMRLSVAQSLGESKFVLQG